jgi:dephospho-CoA kinase
MKIGLTGGIGAGKSTVAHIFETLGIPVYYADEAAKRIMNTDESLKTAICKAFGNEVYINGELNRPHLAALVFSDPDQLALLNSLVHPLTLADAELWMSQQTTPYAIKEAALMLESDAWKSVDKIIGVAAPETLRIQRTMQRDGSTAAAVKARMEQQMNADEKMSRCHFIIHNDEEQLLIPQVLAVHEALLAQAQENKPD